MIYTACYSIKSHWHGEPIAISIYPPKSFKGQQLKFLAPSDRLLKDWKAGMTEQAYIDRFRNELMLISRWAIVRNWLDNLNPAIDQTLLCYEKPGEFCHRNLVAAMVKRHRPDCFGGSDVEVQLCLER